MVKFVEVREVHNYTAINGTVKYTLKEIFINPEHVVCLREDGTASRHLAEGMMPESLDRRQEFTKVHLNRGSSGIDITVVGNPIMTEQKLNSQQGENNNKALLKG